MIRWSRIATPAAIASPLIATFAVCAAFVTWFGVSTAHTVEAAAVDHKAVTLSLIVSYVQHLIDDSLLNAHALADGIADRSVPPADSQLAEFKESAHSASHIRSIVFLDEHGAILSSVPAANEIPKRLAIELPRIAARFGAGETRLFIPIPADAETEADVPDFILAEKLTNGRGAQVVFDMSSRPSGRTSSFDVANIDAAFAMIDTAGSSPVIFGRNPHSPNRIAEVQAQLASENLSASPDASVFCEGNIVFGRRCTVYRRLMNTSIAFASLIGDRELRTEWIQQSRPIWTFALLFLLGGAGSSAFIALWVQQRRRDRLKLAAALEELQQAYAAKSNFMAHMNHELRTPLNAIVGFSELLRGAFFGPLNERYRSYADDIHFSATHLHKLVTEVLNLERLERGKLSLETNEADLNTVVADAVRMLSVLALNKGVKVEFSPWPETAMVPLDPHRTAQIAINLVSNAVKYSEPEDVVMTSVTCTDDGNFALVVADHGIGMTAAEIAHTAQPFGQPADRRSGRHDSVGLGLPIVRGLLATIGGDLIIVSEKHKGTTASAIFGPQRKAA